MQLPQWRVTLHWYVRQCTGAEKRLHALHSHPTFRDPQGFAVCKLTNEIVAWMWTFAATLQALIQLYIGANSTFVPNTVAWLCSHSQRPGTLASTIQPARIRAFWRQHDDVPGGSGSVSSQRWSPGHTINLSGGKSLSLGRFIQVRERERVG